MQPLACLGDPHNGLVPNTMNNFASGAVNLHGFPCMGLSLPANSFGSLFSFVAVNPIVHPYHVPGAPSFHDPICNNAVTLNPNRIGNCSVLQGPYQRDPINPNTMLECDVILVRAFAERIAHNGGTHMQKEPVFVHHFCGRA